MPTPSLTGILGDRVTEAERLEHAERLQNLAKLRDDLDTCSATLRASTAQAIGDARADTPPLTWETIGEALGVTRQRALQFYRQETGQ